jgi:DNA-binding NarL/FixJ family response regulator
MPSTRLATSAGPVLASGNESATTGRRAQSQRRGLGWNEEAGGRPLEIVLVTLREGLAQRVAGSLRHDPRCRLSRGDPVRTRHGAGPDDVDAVLLDHVLYSEIYLNDLNKAARRPVILGLLERSELLSASEFLVRADGLLFADCQGDHAFDAIACAMVGYCAMPADLGQGNPFWRQRLQQARALGALEMQILRMLGRGWSNREIALELGISEARVKAALRALLHKLSLANRTEAAVFYVHNRCALEDTGKADPRGSQEPGLPNAP